MVWLWAIISLALINLAYASVVKRQNDITTLSSAMVNTFTPFTHFASTAYCNPSMTINWTCGTNRDFQPVAVGGDGAATQYWYVGYSPSLNTIIVAHQGTVPSKILPLVTDADFFLERPDPTLFPGIPPTMKIHSGFAEVHASTALTILSVVNATFKAQNVSSIIAVGHSLGAALALLDSVFLKLQLGPNVTVSMVGYGMPRVGNQDFADFVDGLLGGRVTHVNNKGDPIPIVPGRRFGFHQVSGEIHIKESEAWDTCPGQDNPSKLCTAGSVSNILEGTLSDHTGPYAGIIMDCPDTSGAASISAPMTVEMLLIIPFISLCFLELWTI